VILVWIFLLISVVIFSLSTYYEVQYLLGKRDAGFALGKAAPAWFWPFVMAFGLLGIVSAAPGAIFHRPDWLLDKVFGLIAWLTG